MLNTFLKKCDFIGVKPQIFYKGNFRYKTFLGGILSIFIIIILIFLSSYFLYTFLSKNSFTIYENTVTIKKATKKWKKQEFSINVLDKYFERIENASKIFSIYADIWTDTQINENGTIKSKTEIYSVPIEKCNNTLYEISTLWKEEKLINESICFSQEAINNNINLTGAYGETNYTGIVFWISLCTNNTYKNDCYPLEKSKQILDNVFIYVKILDYYFDHSLINDKSIIPYIRSDLIQASSSIYKRQWYLFQEIEYITDEGEIFNSEKKTQIQVLSSYYNSVDNRQNPTIPNCFFALSLNMEGTKKIIKKNYYKLQNLFADINGFFQIIYISIFIINYIYCFNKMNEHIMNDNISNYIEIKEKNFISNLSDNLCANKSSISLINVYNQKKYSSFEKGVNTNTIIFKGENLKKNYSVTPKLLIKNPNINSEHGQQILFERIKHNYKKKNLRLSFFQAFNPILFLCPYNYFHCKNTIIRNFSCFQEILLHQLDINQLLNKLNFIDKFEISFFSSKKSRVLFNHSYNPKIKLYMNKLYNDNDNEFNINFNAENNENDNIYLLREIVINQINDKVNNVSNDYFL